MIFGKKTKKDKRIEELEEVIIQTFLQDETPLDLLKHDIALKMAEFLEDHIRFEVIEVDGRKFLKGTLNVRREK